VEKQVHIGSLLFGCGSALLALALGVYPAHAQAGGGAGCSRTNSAPVYHWSGLPPCAENYREADPYLRYGAQLTSPDPNGGHFDYERIQAARELPKPPHDPDEIAAIVVDLYGNRSVLSRGARSVAEFSDAAEFRSEQALTGLNTATNWVVEGARRALHAGNLPDFRFRSKVRRHYVGLGIQARW